VIGTVISDVFTEQINDDDDDDELI